MADKAGPLLPPIPNVIITDASHASSGIEIVVIESVVRRIVEIVSADGAESVSGVAGVDAAHSVKRGVLVEEEIVYAPLFDGAVVAVLDLLVVPGAVNFEAGLPNEYEIICASS